MLLVLVAGLCVHGVHFHNQYKIDNFDNTNSELRHEIDSMTDNS